LLREFPLPSLREEFPAVDLLVVLGTTLLPQLAAFPMALVNLNPFDPFYGGPLERITDANFLLSSMVCLVIVAAPAIVIGLLWDRKRWLAYAGIFFGVYGLLFSVCLTNFSGVMVGLVGSVNYWMAQQGIARGRQPWYYYILLQIPIYEFLPALLALSAPAAAFLLRRKNPSAAPEGEVRDASAPSSPPAESVWRNIAASPALWMFGYFCVASMAAFTAAGEKMPWLTVHITLPFILIGGWVVGAVAGRTDWARLGRWPSWTGWLMLPAALALALSAVVKLLGTSRPFAGNTEAQLNATADFVSLVFGTAVLIFLLTLLWRGIQRAEVFRVVFLSATLILAVCTLRTAWRAGYIEYDNATEFLVYAHAAGGVKTAVTQIEEISQKTQDDLDIPVPYDIRSGWLLNWYLREYPNRVNYGETLERSFIDEPVVVVGDFYWDQADRLLSDTHYAFTYMRMWWPMMDYFDLTPDRVWNAVSSPTYRSAIWQIWFNRDYAEYAALTGEDLSLSNWPSGERMRLYVRKDLAAQVWQYGSTAFVPPVEADPYAGAVRTLEAAELWGQAGTEPGMLQRPRGIAAAPDGSVYVADTFNHRIQHFDGHGNLLQTWGSYSGGDAAAAADGTFNEPWGVAVGPDGSVYVADTWNYRVQKFTADGGFLAVWGSFTNADDGYQLYGPRAIAVDDEGRVFVADTGNKRITMYDSDGNFLQTIGRPGYDTGQLDEPVGLAVTPGGRLYVADTWNRRIQVFQDYGGNFAYLTEWPIEGWEGESTDTKPYLAVSPDGRLWVTDPGNARILVFDLEGNFLFTFGAFGADAASFALPTGIAVSPDGRIYVTDTDNNRIMVFNAP
jgi:DNA-binding beta-propeller fold protein YncE